MKLYISSYRFGDNPQRLSDLVGVNKKVAVISNALDAYTDQARRESGTQKELDGLTQIGLTPEVLDLRDHFGKPEELENKMAEFGAVWVVGGNTFVLRRAFKESGFDSWLLKSRKDQNFVYAGYSAGICVLSPDLKSIELTDEPGLVPEGYPPEVEWNGLGLISFAFIPHFQSDHPESASANLEVEYLKKNNVEFRTLRDGEVIITETIGD